MNSYGLDAPSPPPPEPNPLKPDSPVLSPKKADAQDPIETQTASVANAALTQTTTENNSKLGSERVSVSDTARTSVAYGEANEKYGPSPQDFTTLSGDGDVKAAAETTKHQEDRASPLSERSWKVVPATGFFSRLAKFFGADTEITVPSDATKSFKKTELVNSNLNEYIARGLNPKAREAAVNSMLRRDALNTFPDAALAHLNSVLEDIRQQYPERGQPDRWEITAAIQVWKNGPHKDYRTLDRIFTLMKKLINTYAPHGKADLHLPSFTSFISCGDPKNRAEISSKLEVLGKIESGLKDQLKKQDFFHQTSISLADLRRICPQLAKLSDSELQPYTHDDTDQLVPRILERVGQELLMPIMQSEPWFQGSFANIKKTFIDIEPGSQNYKLLLEYLHDNPPRDIAQLRNEFDKRIQAVLDRKKSGTSIWDQIANVDKLSSEEASVRRGVGTLARASSFNPKVPESPLPLLPATATNVDTVASPIIVRRASQEHADLKYARATHGFNTDGSPVLPPAGESAVLPPENLPPLPVEISAPLPPELFLNGITYTNPSEFTPKELKYYEDALDYIYAFQEKPDGTSISFLPEDRDDYERILHELKDLKAFLDAFDTHPGEHLSPFSKELRTYLNALVENAAELPPPAPE